MNTFVVNVTTVYGSRMGSLNNLGDEFVASKREKTRVYARPNFLFFSRGNVCQNQLTARGYRDVIPTIRVLVASCRFTSTHSLSLIARRTARNHGVKVRVNRV